MDHVSHATFGKLHQVFEDSPKYLYNVKKPVEYQYFVELLGTTL